MAPNPHDSSVDQRSHVVSPGSANQPTARLAFRWRIIPATVCFIFGPLFIFAGIFAGTRLYGNFSKNLESIDDGNPYFMVSDITIPIAFLVCGVGCVLSGRWFMKGRWFLAIVTVALLYGVSAVAEGIFEYALWVESTLAAIVT